MLMDRITLRQFLTKTLKPFGFRRIRYSEWVKETRYLIKSIIISAPWYAPKRYKLVDFFTVPGIEEGSVCVREGNPKESRLDTLLNLENKIKDEVRKSKIKQILTDYTIPRLDKVNTEEELLRFYAKHKPKPINGMCMEVFLWSDFRNSDYIGAHQFF